MTEPETFYINRLTKEIQWKKPEARAKKKFLRIEEPEAVGIDDARARNEEK